ncbi:hypothetical protein U5640_16920 [Streptomyces sp. SS7]|uniref:hypothetical protein n=1 Tax=Streptomyces sp. SS7 TaxID=3108485 RepID=UPI0030ED5CF0
MRIPFITNWLIGRQMRDLALTALVHSNSHLHEDMNALSGQVKELVATSRRRELVVVAAQHFADVFDDTGLAYDEGDRLNDRQMQALTEVLRAAGHHKGADAWQSYAVPDETDADPFNNEDQEQAEPVSV